jgi:hypothetical protein
LNKQVRGEAMPYETSQINHRATRKEMQARRDALSNIVAELKPCTVRQVFYQATVREVIEKTESGYDKVQTHRLYYAHC